MDEFNAQKLAKILLGLTDEYFNLIINTNASDLDVLLKQKYHIDVKSLGKLTLALLPLVPSINMSTSDRKIHALIKKNKTNNNFYILAEIPCRH